MTHYEQLYGGKLDGMYIPLTYPRVSFFVSPCGRKFERREDGKLYLDTCIWDEDDRPRYGARVD